MRIVLTTAPVIAVLLMLAVVMAAADVASASTPGLGAQQAEPADPVTEPRVGGGRAGAWRGIEQHRQRSACCTVRGLHGWSVVGSDPRRAVRAHGLWCRAARVALAAPIVV